MDYGLLTALALIILVCFAITALIYWDIKQMTKQLKHINENFGTNELVRTHTHGKALSRFASEINRLIQLFKQDQQATARREKRLKQEITNISHDLRTPLTSMKGFSDLLRDPDLTKDEREVYLKTIQEKIDLLTMNVDLFYELAQIDSLDKQFEIVPIDLKQFVIDHLLLFYEKDNDLEIDVADDLNPMIYSDEQALKRITVNVLQNAFRYAESYVKLDFKETDECVILNVKNDLRPSREVALNRIFDRTFTSSEQRSEGQLGLGLHIVKQLIEKQDGQVSAQMNGHEFEISVAFRK